MRNRLPSHDEFEKISISDQGTIFWMLVDNVEDFEEYAAGGGEYELMARHGFETRSPKALKRSARDKRRRVQSLAEAFGYDLSDEPQKAAA